MKNECGTPVTYSVIVLLEEDSDGFGEFIRLLHEIFSAREDTFEILIIANGTEGFLKNESTAFQHDRHVKLFALNRRASQAVCLRTALKESSGDIIMVCGSYQQITRDSFGELLDALDDSTDIISPWRQNRVDPPFNQFQSRIFNEMVQFATGAKLNDLSCTVKVVRRAVLEETELYGNMYRFLPIIAEKKGFHFREVPCEHFQERGKTGFYDFFLYLERLIDILTLYFNTRFTRKPLRFFGAVGGLSFTLGIMILAGVLLQRLFLEYSVGDRPVILFIAVVFIVLGVQAAGVGLLGEIIVFTMGRNIKEYSVSHYASPLYTGPERRNRGRFYENDKYDGDEQRKIFHRERK